MSTSRAAWSIGLLAALLAVVTVAVVGDLSGLRSLDESVARNAHASTAGNELLTTWWSALSHYGQPWALRFVLLVCAGYQWWCGRRALAAWLAAVVVLEVVAAPMSKLAFPRNRPEWANPVTVDAGLSYPSGHAAAAAMPVVSITLLVRTTSLRPPLRRVLVVLVAMIGALISASRVFLGVHYLSDVLAGLLLGTLVVLVAWLPLQRYAARHRPTCGSPGPAEGTGRPAGTLLRERESQDD